MGHPLNAFAIPGLLILITACFNVKPIRTGWNFRAARRDARLILILAHHGRIPVRWAAPAGTRSSARSSGVHTLVVTLPRRAGKKENDMDSAKRCRDQSAECLRLMKLAQSETEARVLRDLAHSWVRLANQMDRYTALVKSNEPDRANGMPRRRTGVAPRSGI
jgi:hypothetical protein